MIIDNMKLKEEARLEILTASNDAALSAETQRQKKQKKIKKQTNKKKTIITHYQMKAPLGVPRCKSYKLLV